MYKGKEYIFNRISLVFLSIVCVYLVLVLFVFKAEFIFSDDLDYAGIAHKYSNKEFKLTNTYAPEHRFAFILPVMLFQKLIGLNIFSLILWPIVSCLLVSFLIFKFISKTNKDIAVFSLIIFLLNPLVIDNSRILLSDMSLTLFWFLAILILYYHERMIRNLNFRVILFSLAIWCAFLTKLTFIYILPPIFFWFIIDVLKKRNLVFWMRTIVLNSILLFVYLLIYHFGTGDAFYRFSLYGVSNEDRLFSDARITHDQIVDRITIDAVKLLIQNPSFWLGTFFYCVSLIKVIAFSRAEKNSFEFFLVMTSTVLLLFFWFMPTSLSSYYPLPLFPRYWLIFVLLFSILGANQIIKIFNGDIATQNSTLIAIPIFIFIDLLLEFESANFVFIVSLLFLYASVLFCIKKWQQIRRKKVLLIVAPTVFTLCVLLVAILNIDFIRELIQHMHYYSKTTRIVIHGLLGIILFMPIIIKKINFKFVLLIIPVTLLVQFQQYLYMPIQNDYQSQVKSINKIVDANDFSYVVVDPIYYDGLQYLSDLRVGTEVQYMVHSDLTNLPQDVKEVVKCALVRNNYFEHIQKCLKKGISNNYYQKNYKEIKDTETILDEIVQNWALVYDSKNYWGKEKWKIFTSISTSEISNSEIINKSKGN